MEAKAKLLYKSYLTHFQTFMPVFFYGMPSRKIYCIYTRFYHRLYDETNLEIVFLLYKNYIYDYDLNIIFDNKNNVISPENFKNQVDQSGQSYIMMKLFGKFKSYNEVQKYMDEKLVEKIHDLELELV
jgi:hypothetical protein